MASPTLKERPTAEKTDTGVNPIWLGIALAVGATALALTLVYSGSAFSNGSALDPGALTRWGLPLAQMVNDYAMATTIGALVFATVILPPHTRARNYKSPKKKQPLAEEDYHPVFRLTLLTAQIASVAWTLAAIAMTVFSFSDIAGQKISNSDQFTTAFLDFVMNISNGQAWLSTAIFAAIISTFAFAFRTYTPLLITLLLAFAGLVPKALIGHSASGDDHTSATNSIFLHLIGASVWVGGIVVLVVISAKLGRDAKTVLTRYSTLALIAFIVVAFSGVINAQVRLENIGQLLSPWGVMVLLKGAGTIVLGMIGFMHRRWLIPHLDGERKFSVRRVLWQLIAVELLIMAAVSAIAVSLSRTAPPRSEDIDPNATPARILTGYELPPELTPERMLTVWRWDWLFLTIILILGIGYARGLWRLHKRGDKWPIMRAVSWFTGLGFFTYVTSGAPGVYGDVLISVHMAEHMIMTMVIPLFLVLGAPVTLALKAIPARKDGSRGPREWILWGVHSPFAKVVTNPIFAAVNFAGSIIIFYSTGFFGFALREHTGHVLMVVHFVVSGYLFALSMVGKDPVPRRAPYPMRLIILLATMAFHAFYGVALMSSNALLQASWFGNLGRDWGPSAIEDQGTGASLMWAIGEIPTVAMAIGVAILWSRSDSREQRRRDRQANRNNEADLTAYNQMFQDMAKNDARVSAGRGSGIKSTTTSGGSPASGTSGGGASSDGAGADATSRSKDDS